MATYNLTIVVTDPSDQPVQGVVCTADLNKVDYWNDQATQPEPVTGTTDATGTCVLALLPNTEGLTDSRYYVTTFDPATGETVVHEIQMPSADSNLEDLITATAVAVLPLAALIDSANTFGTDVAPLTQTFKHTINVSNIGESQTGAGVTVDGVLVQDGQVDGRDVSVDGTKLDTIESGATGDQSAAEIKTAYESNVDTNAFTDAEQSKLSGIEAGATTDQTGAEIKALYEAEANTNAYTDAEQSKLAGIEAGATGDQTAGEIKTAYESNADTNAFTDAEQSKLAGIEAGADITDATNVDAAGAVMNSDTTTAGMAFVINDDSMATASDTTLPTSDSVKQYVLSQITQNRSYKGGYDAALNSPNLDTAPSGVTIGDTYTVTVAGTFFTKSLEVGDVIIAEQDDPTLLDHWTIVNKDLDATSIKTSYESNADTNAFTDAEQSKLSGIEAGATADQTAAEIRTLVEAATDSNVFTDADHSKLNGIESGATADQTGAEIKSLYEAELNTNAFTDAEQSKLSGIESGATADQTGAEIKSLYEAEANTNAFTDSEQSKLAGIESGATADQTGAEIKTAYEAELDTNAFTDAEKSKLAGIEAGATGDQTNAEIRAAVEAATDSNVFTDADHSKLNGIEAGAQVNDPTTVLDADIGVTVQGYSSVLQNTTASYTTAEETKLSGIESGATADQTDAEIRAAVEAATDSNVFTDADHSKLNGIEAGADVTDATNVAAAGAVMDSDFSANGLMKRTGSGTYVTVKYNEAASNPTTTDDTSAGYSIGSRWINTTDDSEFVCVDATASAAVWKTTALATGAGSLIATNNLSDVSDAAASRTNLGVAIGTDVQAYSAVLQNTTASFTTADETKLDGIESGATADQTGAEIKTAYEAEANTNAFTDAEKSKLTGIESGATADQSAGEIEAIVNHDNLVGFVANEHLDWTADQGVTNIHVNNITGLTTSNMSSANVSQFTNDAGYITQTLSDEQVQDKVGAMLTGNTETDITVTYQDIDGTIDFEVNSLAASKITTGTFADARISQSSVTQHQAAINHDSLSGFVANEHIDWTADQGATNIHVNNITGLTTSNMSSANVSQFTNDAGYITATLTDEQIQDKVGAMLSGNTETDITVTYQDVDGTIDFSVNNLAASKITSGTFANARISQASVTQHQAALTITESQISDFGSYQPLATVLTNTTASYTTAEESKLAGIEAGATADQTASEIRALVESATDSNVFTDADHSKLNGIASGAQVNDPTTLLDADIGVNVQAYSAVLAGTTASYTTAEQSKLSGIEAGATADQTAGEIEAIVNHDNLVGFVANEHIDWTADQGATNINNANITGLTTSNLNSANISQFTNDSGYVTEAGDTRAVLRFFGRR